MGIENITVRLSEKSELKSNLKNGDKLEDGSDATDTKLVDGIMHLV